MMPKQRKIFVSYLDDDGQIVSGFYENVEIKDNVVEIRTSQNDIILPIGRVLKIKESRDD